jgi:TctA family transporter
MELSEALERINTIHAQVARTGTFRGYKAVTVGLTGLLAVVVSVIQPLLVPHPLGNVYQYLQLWIGVAAVSVICVAIELAMRYVKSDSPLQRAQTRRAVEQFVPCLAAGACTTWALVRFSPDTAYLLPGLWSIMFSLGVFASCRHSNSLRRSPKFVAPCRSWRA